MTYLLNVYRKDTRTKSGIRLTDSYEFDRKDQAAMEHEIRALYPAYKESDGYIFKIIEV